MTIEHPGSLVREGDRGTTAFSMVDPEEFARGYAHWLDHEGGRKALETDMARTRSESVAMVRRLTGSPEGVPERF